MAKTQNKEKDAIHQSSCGTGRAQSQQARHSKATTAYRKIASQWRHMRQKAWAQGHSDRVRLKLRTKHQQHKERGIDMDFYRYGFHKCWQMHDHQPMHTNTNVELREKLIMGGSRWQQALPGPIVDAKRDIPDPSLHFPLPW